MLRFDSPFVRLHIMFYDVDFQNGKLHNQFYANEFMRRVGRMGADNMERGVYERLQL